MIRLLRGTLCVILCGLLGTFLGHLTVEYRWFNIIMSIPTVTVVILWAAIKLGRYMDV